jgi:hypothetical protein
MPVTTPVHIPVYRNDKRGTPPDWLGASADTVVPVPDGWLESVFTSQVAHVRIAERSRLWGRGLGLLALTLTTVTGTTLFTTLQDSPGETLRTWLGAFAAVTAVVVAVNTFFAFGDRENVHRMVSARYGALKHELQEFSGPGVGMTAAHLDDFRSRWDGLAAESPTVGTATWRRANEWVLAHPGRLSGVAQGH